MTHKKVTLRGKLKELKKKAEVVSYCHKLKKLKGEKGQKDNYELLDQEPYKVRFTLR